LAFRAATPAWFEILALPPSRLSSNDVAEATEQTRHRRDMLGDLIAALERPEVVANVLSTLDPELAAKVAERAAKASMSVGDFSAGAVRAFLDEADDDLWFQLLTLIRKSEDPGLSAVQTILRWVLTA